MDFQTGFNAIMGLLLVLAGWMLNVLYSSMRDLSKADKDLTDKVQAIEVLVAGQYVMRSEFEHKMSAFFAKLEKFDEKLDRILEKGKS